MKYEDRPEALKETTHDSADVDPPWRYPLIGDEEADYDGSDPESHGNSGQEDSRPGTEDPEDAAKAPGSTQLQASRSNSARIRYTKPSPWRRQDDGNFFLDKHEREFMSRRGVPLIDKNVPWRQ